MTISLKKVTAGSGYTYLTQQVAAQDGMVRTGLAAYYEEKGEAPGVWMGAGLDGLDGINAGDSVTEAQMLALFAAVLDSRLQLLVPEKTPGPLPWLRGIPSGVAQDGLWGRYLQARADRIDVLADGLRREVRSHHFPPSWLGSMSLTPRMFENGVLLGDITVWRAVMEVPASDARATGTPAMGDAAARWQRDLDARLDRSLGTGEWGRLLPTLDPVLVHDPQRLVIARRLNGLEERGLDVGGLVERALGDGPLPNERPASALWSRIAGIAGVWQGWPPPRRTEEVWETVTPPPRRRPEHKHMPGHGHDRHGPSIGF